MGQGLKSAVLIAEPSTDSVFLSWDENGKSPGFYDVLRQGVLLTTLAKTVQTYIDTAVVADGTTYTYQIRSHGDGDVVLSNEVTVNLLLTPAPITAPTLTGTSGATQVSLLWTAVANADSYTVQRKSGSDAFSDLVSQAGLTYLNTGLTNATAYTYRVRGTANSGADVGPWSNEVTKTPTASVPVAPTLTGTASDSENTLDWNSVANATLYRLRRQVGTNPLMAFPDTAATDYIDDTVTNGTTYQYTVRGIASDGTLGSISPAVDLTPVAMLTSPVLSGSTSGGSNVLSWTAVPMAATYRLNVAINGGGYNPIYEGSLLTFTHSGVSGSSYEYFVRPIDAAGNLGALSNYVTLTPAASLQTVTAGQNIGTLLASNNSLRLLTGNHVYFTVPADGVRRTITFDAGAVVQGGILIPAGAVCTLNSPVVTAAVFGITVRGSAIINNPDVYGCGDGIKWDGTSATGSVMGGKVHDNTRMVRNDTTAGNDYGAIGMEFNSTLGPITIDGVSVYNQRVMGSAPTSAWNDNGVSLGVSTRAETLSYDYGTNEGSAFELFEAAGVTIQNCRIYNCQVTVETGRNSGGPQCGFTFRRNAVWNGKTDTARVSKGMLLRTASPATIEHNVFDRMDDWAITVTGGGGFGGSVQGLVIRDNIAVNPAALIQVGSPSGTWTHDYDMVTSAWGSGGTEAHGLLATPLFVNATTHDYHLQASSPAIGAAHDGSNIGIY